MTKTKTSWRDGPATSKQITWITRLADEKDTSSLDEVLLDTIADVASGVTITGGQASDLLDVLFALKRTAKPIGGFATLTSDYAERLARWKALKAQAETVGAEADAAEAAAGGTASEGACVKCGHDHSRVSEKGGCGASVEWRGSDYYDYYTCECTETARGTAATEAARKLQVKALGLQVDAGRAGLEAEELCKGDHVTVARGRKIKKGTTGQILTIRDGSYGKSAFLLLADGSKAWTSLTNLDHKEV